MSMSMNQRYDTTNTTPRDTTISFIELIATIRNNNSSL